MVGQTHKILNLHERKRISKLINLPANPICSSNSEEQMVGRSNATSTKFMRPKEAHKFVCGDCEYKNLKEKKNEKKSGKNN